MSYWNGGGAVAVGGWSVSLATHFTRGPPAPPAPHTRHAPRHSPSLSSWKHSPVFRFLVCRVSYLLSVVLCFCLASVFCLQSSVCPVLFVSMSVCLCLWSNPSAPSTQPQSSSASNRTPTTPQQPASTATGGKTPCSSCQPTRHPLHAAAPSRQWLSSPTRCRGRRLALSRARPLVP